jgi:hypothetical protein
VIARCRPAAAVALRAGDRIADWLNDRTRGYGWTCVVLLAVATMLGIWWLCLMQLVELIRYLLLAVMYQPYGTEVQETSDVITI